MLATALSANAQAAERESLLSEGGTGVGALIATLIYAPLKLAYAAGGVAIAGVTWLWTWGNADVASTVARVATDGDYVITPAHLRRQSDLDFDGDS